MLRGKITEQLNVWGIVLTIGILLVLSIFIDIDTMKEFVLKAGVWAPLLFIVLKASTVIIAPLSGGPLYPIVGLLFGFWPGILFVVAGDFLGYSGAFLISRIFGYPVVGKIIAGNERSMLAKIVKHVGTTKGFIHMCFTCFALPELISYGAGLSKLPYWKFISILMPLSVIASSILVFFGSSLGAADHPLILTLLIPLFGGAVMLLGGWLFIQGVRKKDPIEEEA
ncbi:VTT domain-containing protein [Patescibacteria group bacterium]|nr:VTT domain-containing protein [Patescibacteria group bacterium]MBU1755372.1 VTT domain-containing protein [Patescibacteria group bacterium]